MTTCSLECNTLKYQNEFYGCTGKLKIKYCKIRVYYCQKCGKSIHNTCAHGLKKPFRSYYRGIKNSYESISENKNPNNHLSKDFKDEYRRKKSFIFQPLYQLKNT